MVILNKSWVGPGQTAFTSSVDQAVQYRQFLYALKTAFLAAGWTVERSSNGTNYTGDGAGGVTDNWASSADVVYGTEASQAHSWISLAAPTGKGGPSGGSEYRLLINCNEDNADTTPNSYDLYLARGTYGGGDLTTIPTITGVQLSVLSLANGIPWAAATAGSFCIWRTDDGDVYWGVKSNADSFFRVFGWVRDDDTDALGNYHMHMAAWNSATLDVVTSTNMGSVTNHRNFRADGAAASTAAVGRCTAWDMSSWSGGQASGGQVLQRDVELLSNSATAADCRLLGLLVDIRGVPGLLGWMHGDINDDGAAAPFELLSIGDIMIPCDAEIT